MYQNFNQASSDTANMNMNEDQFLHFFERVITESDSQQNILLCNDDSLINEQSQQFSKQNSKSMRFNSVGQSQFQINSNNNSTPQVQKFGNMDINYGIENNNNNINLISNNNMLVQQLTPSSSSSSASSNSSVPSMSNTNNTVTIDSNILSALNRGTTVDNGESNIEESDPTLILKGNTDISNGKSLPSLISKLSPSITPVSDPESKEERDAESTSFTDVSLPIVKINSNHKVGKVKKRKKKTSHNVIEKKYRLNINDKISQLRDIVPTISVTYKEFLKVPIEQQDIINLDGLEPTHKLNKGSILNKTIEYIKHLQKRCDEYRVRNDLLEKYFVNYPQAQQTNSILNENSYVKREYENTYQ
ncbi:similar to Saccharomyces cerevisiae YOR032C HMS1 Basic helix-loop-helix (bHLH) protein with similarity to myc-family transcription factors [Maudiozyma saulgeensis]|uniref:Similar to Saccharomyces cerevisiae YOR032C HMS1 Basic helix-loop-helix (BHLH) protein with similarity to myc-family transcription factors n=1 Tax=Maudiozyma saulgeensis TaxID=1789683 RepID=A0A1X7QWZ7_9SACH|nr:similar to Saccharomyces cerevisiae YOR032C HMS1 Basic helix-loop-helix (bHLH) protein with similarity to myc-family transcription factors [Kazachstania saulgeensis]